MSYEYEFEFKTFHLSTERVCRSNHYPTKKNIYRDTRVIVIKLLSLCP